MVTLHISLLTDIPLPAFLLNAPPPAIDYTFSISRRRNTNGA